MSHPAASHPMRSRLVSALLANEGLVGLGIDEGAAVLLRGGRDEPWRETMEST